MKISFPWGSEKPNICVGIIGLGHISDIHIKAFQAHHAVTIGAIVDTNRAALTEKSFKLGGASPYTDYHKVFEDPRVDVVDILLPHYLHARVTCEALKAGKHVICEKPLAINPRDIDSIMAVSRKMKRNVYLKQYFRFSTLHQKVKNMILQGDIGKPYLVACIYTTDALAQYNDPKLWRGNAHEAGGGIFMDVGIHMIDYLQELFGYPTSVTGVIKKNFTSLQMKGEDLSVVTLEFQSGIVVNIICSAVDTSYGFRWEKHFYGSDGSLHLIDYGKPRMELGLQKNKDFENIDVEMDWWDRANISALHDIIERITHDEPPAVSLQDAKKTIKAIVAAYQSAELNRKVHLA